MNFGILIFFFKNMFFGTPQKVIFFMYANFFLCMQFFNFFFERWKCIQIDRDFYFIFERWKCIQSDRNFTLAHKKLNYGVVVYVFLKKNSHSANVVKINLGEKKRKKIVKNRVTMDHVNHTSHHLVWTWNIWSLSLFEADLGYDSQSVGVTNYIYTYIL